MSYSWHVSGERKSGANRGEVLGSAAVETPLTPPSVRNVTPATCLSMVQFRALMQEYRSLDDSVTTRLNRTLANSRASGLTSSPSLLSTHVASNSSLDLGKSTYASAPEQACLSFWLELVNVWIGREEVLNYCMKIEERQRLENDKVKAGEEWILNRDIDQGDRQTGYGQTGWTKSSAKVDTFDSRASRSEDSGEALHRQLRNELSIESIIRKRSLDVFKSRCRFFTPPFSNGPRGKREKSMWNGIETPLEQQVQR